MVRIKRTGIKIIDDLQRLSPKREVVLIAIEHITCAKGMRDFIDAYANYIESLNIKRADMSPKAAARADIFYLVGSYPVDIESGWKSVIRDLNSAEQLRSDKNY